MDMLRTERPDFVVVASPTQFHAEHAIHAMEIGIDVFLEKPMARDLREALRIYETQKKTGRKLMVYQPRRVLPETITIKRIMEKGILGDVYMMKSAMSVFFIRTNWQAYQANGGGTLNNHGSHYIDLLLYLSGGKAKTISCELQKVLTTGDADDCAKVMIKTDNGMLLDIDMNMASAIGITPWQIFGTRGSAIYTVNDKGKPVMRTKYCYPNTVLEKSRYLHHVVKMDDGETLWHTEDFEIKEEDAVNFYDKCYEYFGLNKDPFVPIEDTLAVMEVLKKCHEVTGEY